ncbi:unnamed protein product [Amoebophrya sp. A120]|nr:unnamed protein product [Amoebophrya sp. A120]|eukprot:GSA120T00005935001.1
MKRSVVSEDGKDGHPNRWERGQREAEEGEGTATGAIDDSEQELRRRDHSTSSIWLSACRNNASREKPVGEKEDYNPLAAHSSMSFEESYFARGEQISTRTPPKHEQRSCKSSSSSSNSRVELDGTTSVELRASPEVGDSTTSAAGVNKMLETTSVATPGTTPGPPGSCDQRNPRGPAVPQSLSCSTSASTRSSTPATSSTCSCINNLSALLAKDQLARQVTGSDLWALGVRMKRKTHLFNGSTTGTNTAVAAALGLTMLRAAERRDDVEKGRQTSCVEGTTAPPDVVDPGSTGRLPHGESKNDPSLVPTSRCLTVLDPMCGTGTLPLVMQALSSRFNKNTSHSSGGSDHQPQAGCFLSPFSGTFSRSKEGVLKSCSADGEGELLLHGTTKQQDAEDQDRKVKRAKILMDTELGAEWLQQREAANKEGLLGGRASSSRTSASSSGSVLQDQELLPAPNSRRRENDENDGENHDTVDSCRPETEQIAVSNSSSGRNNIKAREELLFPATKFHLLGADCKELAENLKATSSKHPPPVDFLSQTTCNRLPFRSGVVDLIFVDPPWGQRHGSHTLIQKNWKKWMTEWVRVLRDKSGLLGVVTIRTKQVLRDYHSFFEKELELVSNLMLNNAGYQQCQFFLFRKR